MLLDTSHTAAAPSGEQPPLGLLREQLIGEYPQVGPIFA